MAGSEDDNAPNADSNDYARTDRDGTNTDEIISPGDIEPPSDGLGSTSIGNDQSKVFGVFAKIQPTGSPIMASVKPFTRGYHNYFLGEMRDAGALGVSFLTLNMIFPRLLDDTLARQKSKDLGLPISFRFRVLTSAVKSSYMASSWLALAASFSMAGIDIGQTSGEFRSRLGLVGPRPDQSHLDGRDESVAEYYTAMGFLAGFPFAYAIFRDGGRASNMGPIVPHLLPLNRLPLYVGIACMSAGAFTSWNRVDYKRE